MMDLSSGLMGATGLGVFIYIKDMFSSQAVKIGAQASILEGRMAKSAAGIRGSMTMMGGGLAVAGIGIAALKLGDMIARQAEGIDEKVRELRIKGFPAEEAAKVKAQVRGLASEIGIIPQEAMTASVWAAEYGLRRAEDITAALRTTFRAAVGTGTEAVATSEGLLRTMAGFGYGPSSLPMISGKMQIGADEMRISFGELTSVFPEAISLSRLYGLSLDDMLVNLVAAKYGGMDAGRALAGMRMSFMMLEAPQGKMAERLAAIRNGEVMAAIQAGHMGDALRMLSEEMAGLGASERAGFLKSLGVGGRQATVLNALIENAPKVKGLYAELGGWAEREQRSFEEMNASYGHQLAIRSVRLKNIGITLGEAVKKSNAPFLETQNKLLLGIDNFIRGNEKAVVAIMAPTRTLGRLAVVAGLSTAGIGLLRFGLIKAGVSAVQGAGMFSTLGIGIKAALTSMLPVALTIAGIALAGTVYLKQKHWA
ncbi:MAG: phage tail tape measure protein, partial [Chlamydiota bacterium]